jgi:spermidine synthase
MSIPSIRQSLDFLKPSFMRWMFFSGAAALMYEVMAQKILAYITGVSLVSAVITIAAYMLGFAVGSLLSVPVTDRPFRLLRLFQFLQFAMALAAVGLIVFYGQFLYWVNHIDRYPVIRTLLTSLPSRSLLSLLILLPLTIPMGMTFPVLSKILLSQTDARSGSGGKRGSKLLSPNNLYFANLVGAIAGALIAPYAVIPYLGLLLLTLIGAAMNLYVCVSAWRYEKTSILSGKDIRMNGPENRIQTDAGNEMAGMGPFVFYGLSFFSGFVVFALEIIWMHLLASVVGASVFAFSTMLAAVLLSLGLAAWLETKVAFMEIPLNHLLFTAAVCLSLTIPLYSLSGFIFSFFGIFRPGFYFRELIRFLVAAMVIIPPALFLSRIYPRLLHAPFIRAANVGKTIGKLTAWNTLGSILGLMTANFLMIPQWGSSFSLRFFVVLFLLSALLIRPATKTPGKFGEWFQAKAAGSAQKIWLAAALLAFLLPSWHLPLLLSGRNIYFYPTSNMRYSKLLYQREDAEGGFTTVGVKSDGTREMLTNGKFQGSDGTEMQAQLAFGILPSLCAQNTRNAYVIGFGTGVTSRGLALFPYAQIDVAELSLPIFKAASFFDHVNGRIMADPRLRMIHNDGRFALMVSPFQYDVISVEITSIWFAGAGNLYNREFYEIAKRKLADGGVLQQWVQLHHMRPLDLLVLFNTARSVFPYAAFWYSGNQGQLILSSKPVAVNWGLLSKMVDGDTILLTPPEKSALIDMVGKLLIDNSGMDRILRSDKYIGRSARALLAGSGLLISTDLHPYLEYNTPKGNALDLTEFLNVEFFRMLAGGPPRLAFRNLSAPDFPAAQSMVQINLGEFWGARYWLEKMTDGHPEMKKILKKLVESLSIQEVMNIRNGD